MVLMATAPIIGLALNDGPGHVWGTEAVPGNSDKINRNDETPRMTWGVSLLSR